MDKPAFTLRTLDPDGSLPINERPCAHCGKLCKKIWPSFASFVVACSQEHADKADDEIAEELEKEMGDDKLL
jgi:hypothetical protein